MTDLRVEKEGKQASNQRPITGRRVGATQVAGLYGVTSRAVREWVEHGCPAKRGARGQWMLALGEVIRWREEQWQRRVQEAEARVTAALESTEAGGRNSPALEDYRRERAALARLERLERERKLADLEMVRMVWLRLAPILRGGFDQLQKRFGVDALKLMEERVHDWEVAVTEALENWNQPQPQADGPAVSAVQAPRRRGRPRKQRQEDQA